MGQRYRTVGEIVNSFIFTVCFVPFLSYLLSIAVIKHHDQSNACVELGFQFQRLRVHDSTVKSMMAGTAESSHLKPEAGGTLGMTPVF